MRTAFVSLHSHGDRSFLDDNALAHTSGELHLRGYENDLVVVALDGSVDDPSDTPAFERLVEVLRPYDVVVYERTWTRAIPAALVDALPDATVVHLEGEHRLADPPGAFVCEQPFALRHLLDYIAGARESLPAHTRRRDGDAFAPGLGALERDEPLGYAPNLAPVVVNPGDLPASRPFSIDGNAGCPYQADARENPLYAGIELPDGVGRGCAFCTTGNHYAGRSHTDAIEHVLEQLRYVRAHGPDIDVIVLRDQNPFGYLTEVLQACAREGVGDFTLLLQTRADWLLAGGRRFGLALEAAARANITVTPFLVGIESFSQAELDRFNKGVTVETNRELLARLRAWTEEYTAFDLSRASFGFILFSPWTTMDDLERNCEGIAATRLDELRGKLLCSRVRLYPDTALYYLARRDGLLLDADDGTAAAGRYGYFPDAPWRFADDRVAAFAHLAERASDATDGRDELRLFRCLLDAFAGADDPAEVTLDDVLRAFRPPAPKRAPAAASRPSRRTVEVDAGRGCTRGCALCAPARADAPDVASSLGGGGARVVVRGLGADWSSIEPIAARAAGEGFGEIVAALHADVLAEPGSARRLAAMGVTGVLAPVFSHAPAAHDRIAGGPDRLVGTLVGLRAVAAAGLTVEVEVPLLASRLQDLTGIVDLVYRAVPEVRAVRFFIPRRVVPNPVAPPPMDEAGRRLEAAIARAAELGIATPLDVTSAIPMCAVNDHATARTHLRFDPRKPTRVGGCAPVSACERCAVVDQCCTVAASYARAHGAAHIHPLDARPRDLYEQRTTPRRQWDDTEREAARNVGLLVLRPTVHCNQDCSFCSANESTQNVWAEPAKMKRAIARAAQRGVERISFSGGEPTLARELPAYIEIARTCGVDKIELVTNAVLLDRRERVDALAAAGLTHAFVSLHGHDELVSRSMTRKEGDFSRTVAGIANLVDAGVVTVINHVVNARNYRFLPLFVDLVHERYGGRVLISFAFVTPQFKALENIHVVPRLSDVMPFLHAASWRALELGQPFVIGSRQGVPPCLLGPFEAWSDVLHLGNEAKSEDAPQKQRAPGCDECRYTHFCTGLWRPYVARFGTDELVPIGGEAIDAARRDALMAHARKPPFGQPMAFDEVPDELRRPDLEAAGPAVVSAPEVDVGVDEVADGPSRPLRLLMIGSGRRARELAGAALRTPGLAIAGVCSPHAEAADLSAFGGCPAFADLADALDATRPDGAIVASSTPSHVAVARAVIDAGVPLLVEKPVATSAADARALAEVAAAAGVRLLPAHNDAFAAGLDAFFDVASGTDLTIARVTPPDAPDAPPSWSRPGLYESLYHLVVLAHQHAGADLAVDRVTYTGERRPERLRVELRGGDGNLVITWDLTGRADTLTLSTATATWRRAGRDVTLDTGAGREPIERTGSDIESMLAAFRDAVRGDATPPVDPADGAEVMAITARIMDALDAAGAPFKRAASPRHAASRSLSRRYE